MGEVVFANRPVKPLVERSSRSTLTDLQLWGFDFNYTLYNACYSNRLYFYS